MNKRNLQPWLDYFDMLQVYEETGFLEVQPDKRDAYVTQPALHALSVGDDPSSQSPKAILSTVRRICAYAGWKSQQGGGFLDDGFALHVVKDQSPYDLLYTILLTRRRKWWRLWCKTDSVDVIEYARKKNP